PPSRVGSENHIVFDGLIRKDKPSFWDEGESAVNLLVSGLSNRLLSFEEDLSGGRTHQAADPSKYGRFPRTIIANHCYQFATFDCEVDATHRNSGAVADFETPHIEKHF